MNEKEYNDFAKQFNKWAKEQNEKVEQAKTRLGIKSPVMAEKIQNIPYYKDLDKISNISGTETISDLTNKYKAIAKEQMLTQNVKMEFRSDGIINFVDMLGDKELSDKIREMDDYERQSLISTHLLPQYVPYMKEFNPEIDISYAENYNNKNFNGMDLNRLSEAIRNKV